MSANPVKNRFRPNCETLETRDLMSVTSVVLDAGVLKVTLDNGNDFVRISESSPLVLTAASELPAANSAASTTSPSSAMFLVNEDLNVFLQGAITVTDATRNGVSWSFNRGSVKSILVENHNSFGDINTIVSTSSLKTVVDLRNSKSTNHVETGAGNDTVFGSDGKDTIFTNAGNDTVAAGAGDDRIDSGLGADTVVGGVGNDTIIDAIKSSDTNLLYGDAGFDTLFSASKNDVVDGGTEIDTVSVKTGTFVRNAESASITDVPLGNGVSDPRVAARKAANRFLQAHGRPTITRVIVVNDSRSGLTASAMVNLVREKKPDATLLTGTSRPALIARLLSGKPVIAKFGVPWVVYTGFDQATQRFTFVNMRGEVQTSLLSTAKRDIIF